MAPLIDIISNITKKKVITGSVYFSNYKDSSKSYTDISISGITDETKCIVEIINNPTNIYGDAGRFSILVKGYAELLSKNVLRVYQPTIEYEYSYSDDTAADNWNTRYLPCTLQWRITQYY